MSYSSRRLWVIEILTCGDTWPLSGAARNVGAGFRSVSDPKRQGYGRRLAGLPAACGVRSSTSSARVPESSRAFGPRHRRCADGRWGGQRRGQKAERGARATPSGVARPWHPSGVMSKAENWASGGGARGASGRHDRDPALQRRRVHRGDAPFGARPDLPAVRGDRGRRRVDRRRTRHRAGARLRPARPAGVAFRTSGSRWPGTRARRGRRRTSQYLLFLDADDLWDPEALATLVDALDRRPDAAGSFVLADYIDGDGNVLTKATSPGTCAGARTSATDASFRETAPPTCCPSTCSCPTSCTRRAACCCAAPPTRLPEASTAGSSPRTGSSSRGSRSGPVRAGRSRHGRVPAARLERLG